MKKELQNYQIASFAIDSTYESIQPDTLDQLKKHLLDAIGSLLYAIPQPPIQKLLRQISFLDKSSGPCEVPSLKGTSFDRGAQLYTALIRYPDFMDNYMGKEATCHPSDNLGMLLSVAQIKNTSGREFLSAMAVCYEVECRLVEEIPVMIEGIDHTLFLAYSMISGAGKLIGLTRDQMAHALGIAGTSISPLVTSRASYTSEWKGLVSSLEAFNCMNILLLAKEGMTGPTALFEGPKGFNEIFKMKLDYDWKNESFELIRKCVLKEFNAEVHAQSTLEATLELRDEHDFKPADIEKIEITTFLTAYHIIGSGAYGDRTVVQTKEQADHSLFYLVAVLILDGEVYPEQFHPDRIREEDVQSLLQKIEVKTGLPLHKPIKIAGMLDPYTAAYPEKMKTKVEVLLKNGEKLTKEKEDYYGFFTRPLSWQSTIDKFKRLTSDLLSESDQEEIIQTVKTLEEEPDVRKLIRLLCIKPEDFRQKLVLQQEHK
jgi:2-methylcitrate dehydratase